MILMKDLVQLYTDMGFSNVVTYIQSGNVVFESEREVIAPELEDILEKSILKNFGFEVPVFVRSANDWAEMTCANPFLGMDSLEINCLHLTCLKEFPTAELLELINNCSYLPDQFKIIGKDAFIYCANGYGKPKITNDFFEKKLKMPATTRNWKTVLQINELELCGNDIHHQ